MKKSIPFAAFLIGFTAMSAQIVFLRQMVTLFYGNELSLGVLLGAWLFWGAAGSWLFGRFSDRIKNGPAAFAFFQVILAFVLTGTFLALRTAGAFLGVLPGEIAGLAPMLAFTFVNLSLTCIILGFLFTLACRIYPFSGGASGAVNIGRVYILEAMGALCGGLGVSFLFIRYFDGLYIMLGLSCLNLISSFILHRDVSRPKVALFTRYVSLILIVLLALSVITQKTRELKQASIERQWRHLQLLAARDSIYSNLVVGRKDEQYSFFSNGAYLFSVPDIAAREEEVHFALLQTPEPQKVLLIGGGISGAVSEILKHPVASLDYVELDPEIITLGREFLPPEKTNFLKDSRLKIFHQDGRLFVRQAHCRYDSIIVNLGDPYTAQINRFYTLEFFREVKRHLSPEGVFSFGMSSSENFLNREQRQLFSCIYKTLSAVFAEVKVIPGETACFLAANKKGILTRDYKSLVLRLKQRRVKTSYVNEYYLASRMSPERTAYLEAILTAGEKASLNTDFRPVSYYYDMVLWSTRFAPIPSGRKVFSRLNQESLWIFFSFLYLSIMAAGFSGRRNSRAKKRAVILAVSTAGFAEIVFQVVILLAFQILYGYLYYKLGIILTLFMLGLVLGSRLATNRLDATGDDYGLFITTHVVISIYPLILPLVFYALNAGGADGRINWMGSNIIFPFLPVIAGFAGGFQFPLANRVVLKDSGIIGRTSGLTYGMDLLGACVGALLVSAFLVPILGITRTCIAVSLLNCSVLFALKVVRR